MKKKFLHIMSVRRIILLFSSSLLFIDTAHSQNRYFNPILAGFYPDPSICKKGNDYYMVNSTFAYYPGIPVFHSKDLINWEQEGSAINRPDQINLIGQGVSRGLFAPSIRENKGIFYITCTLIDNGGNFIITSKNPEDGWSNPIWLKGINGIDPSLFFDNNKIYLVYNSDAPENKPLYEGHRTIRMQELNAQLQPVGKEKILVNGGTDISVHPVWIEGPHLYKINDWYYLMCAQGGTGINHSEVLFRSKSLNDKFIPYEHNPILTQAGLNSSRKDPITCTGHADLVQVNDGNWYAVFLGCRSYSGENYFNTGRETFMAPVIWNNDWFVIDPNNEAIKYSYPTPGNNLSERKNNNTFSGNYSFYDSFSANVLSDRYLFLRNFREPWYKINNHKLTVKLKPETCQSLNNPAFIGFRQAHQKCDCVTDLHFISEKTNEQAGLLIFQNETHYYFLCKTIINNQPAICLLKSPLQTNETCEQLAIEYVNNAKDIYLKIVSDKDVYSFYYSYDNKKWNSLKLNVDGKYLSTEEAGGFVGCLFAMYATSDGVISDNKAIFKSFEYNGNDDIYK